MDFGLQSELIFKTLGGGGGSKSLELTSSSSYPVPATISGTTEAIQIDLRDLYFKLYED